MERQMGGNFQADAGPLAVAAPDNWNIQNGGRRAYLRCLCMHCRDAENVEIEGRWGIFVDMTMKNW